MSDKPTHIPVAFSRPSGYGKKQQEFEPPRITDNQSKMDGNIDEPSVRMDLCEMSNLSNKELEEVRDWMVSYEELESEISLIGNGVVPSTTEIAFRVLYSKLNNNRDVIK